MMWASDALGKSQGSHRLHVSAKGILRSLLPARIVSVSFFFNTVDIFWPWRSMWASKLRDPLFFKSKLARLAEFDLKTMNSHGCCFSTSYGICRFWIPMKSVHSIVFVPVDKIYINLNEDRPASGDQLVAQKPGSSIPDPIVGSTGPVVRRLP